MDKFEIDIKGLILFVLRKAIYLIIAAVICACIGYIYAKSLTPLYTATASLYVNNVSESLQSEVKKINSSDMTTSQKLVQTYLQFLKSSKVLDEVSKQLNNEYSSEQIKGMMSTQAMNDTEIFQINITTADKTAAMEIANAIAKKAPQIIQGYIKGSSVEIVDYAKEPEIRTFPSFKKYISYGAFVGGAVSFVIIVLIFLFKTNISTKEEIEKLFTAPVIGEIPNFMQIETMKDKYHYAYYQRLQNKSERRG